MSRRETYTTQHLQLLDHLIPSNLFKTLLTDLLNAAATHKGNRRNTNNGNTLINELAKLELAIAIKGRLNQIPTPPLRIANQSDLQSIYKSCEEKINKILSKKLTYEPRSFDAISFEDWEKMQFISDANIVPEENEAELRNMHIKSEAKRSKDHLEIEERRKEEVEKNHETKQQRQIERIWERQIGSLTPIYRHTDRLLSLFLTISKEQTKKNSFANEVQKIFRSNISIISFINDGHELSEKLTQERGKAATHENVTYTLQTDIMGLTEKVNTVIEQNENTNRNMDEVKKEYQNLNATLKRVQIEREDLNATLQAVNERLEREAEERGDLNQTLAEIRQQLAATEAEKSILFELVKKNQSGDSSYYHTSMRSKGNLPLNSTLFQTEASKQTSHAQGILQKNLHKDRYNCIMEICKQIKRSSRTNKPLFHELLETMLMPSSNNLDEDRTVESFLDQNKTSLNPSSIKILSQHTLLEPNTIPKNNLTNYYKAIYTLYKYGFFYYPSDIQRYHKFVTLKNEVSSSQQTNIECS